MKIVCIKIRYSVEQRDRIYVKGYGFLSFAKNMGKSLSNKYGQKIFDSAKKSTTDAMKIASKRAIQKTAEATGDLIDNKIADKIRGVSKKKPTKELHNNDETEEDVEITTHKKRYISSEERQQIMDELVWWISIDELTLIHTYFLGTNLSIRLVPKKYVWVKVNIKTDNKLFIN